MRQDIRPTLTPVRLLVAFLAIGGAFTNTSDAGRGWPSRRNAPRYDYYPPVQTQPASPATAPPVAGLPAAVPPAPQSAPAAPSAGGPVTAQPVQQCETGAGASPRPSGQSVPQFQYGYGIETMPARPAKSLHQIFSGGRNYIPGANPQPRFEYTYGWQTVPAR